MQNPPPNNVLVNILTSIYTAGPFRLVDAVPTRCRADRDDGFISTDGQAGVSLRVPPGALGTRFNVFVPLEVAGYGVKSHIAPRKVDAV
jgi:hypothetical protein